MDRSELIFFLIAAVIGVVKWVMERGKGEEGAPPNDAERQRRLEQTRREQAGGTVNRRAATAEEERVRKFMEALGLPTEAAPPPPAPPRGDTLQREIPSDLQREIPEVRSPVDQPSVPAPAVPPPLAPTPRTIRRTTQAPAKTQISPPLAPAVSLMDRLSELTAQRAAEDAQEAAAFAIRTPQRHLASSEESSGERLIDFGSRQAVRRAFVMSEVLGRPKGLQ